MPTFGSLDVEVGHERAVDLDRVERQLAQVGQRRVAGPEVVEDDADAQRAELLQDAEARLGAVHDAGLGDLQLERARLEAGRRRTWPMPLARSGSRNWRGDRLTLITRFSSGQRWRQQLRLAAGLLEDHPADRDDQLGLLGEGDEVDRQDEAARRVLPAGERLEADDRASVRRSRIGW